MVTQSPPNPCQEEHLDSLARRKFMTDTAALARGSLLVLSMPAILTACREAREAHVTESAFKTLSEAEALEFAAIAARIFPTDETPGATEAGVIYFIDNVLGDESRQDQLAQLRTGLDDLHLETASAYGSTTFHELDADQQDAMLTRIETTAFFQTIRYLTIAGMFSMPMYGGNRDGIGFELIAMEQRPVWEPPFSFYDADYRAKGE